MLPFIIVNLNVKWNRGRQPPASDSVRPDPNTQADPEGERGPEGEVAGELTEAPIEDDIIHGGN